MRPITLIRFVLALAIALVTSSCLADAADSALSISASDRDAAPLERHHLTRIVFSKWVDLVQIDGVLEPLSEEEGSPCRFVSPQVQDGTTRWSPLQIYWVRVANRSGLVAGFYDTYFRGDRVTADEFRSGGQTIAGLGVLSSLNLKFFSISDLTLTENDTHLTATVSVPLAGVSLALTITATRENGHCAPTVFGNGRAMSMIYIKQNFIGYITEVVIK